MRQAIVSEALKWVGTPFRHQGRALGVGVDCVGLPLCVAQALGLLPPEFRTGPYGRQPHVPDLLARAGEVLTEISPREAQGGDIVLMAVPPERVPMHFGILTLGGGVIHASEPLGRVVKHGMSALWWSCVKKVYRFPGVEA